MAIDVRSETFAAIVGADRVFTDPETLAAYAADVTENPAGRVDLVVRPTSAEQVQEVVRAAAAERLPVTPAVARMNVGGLAIPQDGGVVVDLSDMNRVVELDLDHMYAVIEPGVTFAQMSELFRNEARGLTLSFPLAPPHTSVVANFLMDGLGNLSLLYGSAGEQIGGLEAVLADGTMVRTGAGAVSPVWFSRGPLPDLTGLFVNWQGASGIVTKLAVQLWPAPPLTRRLFVFSESLSGSWELMRELALRGVCRDVSGLSWPVAKMLFGVDRPLLNDPGEPELYVSVDLGGGDEEEIAYKERAVREIVGRHRESGLPVAGIVAIDELIEVAPSLARFAEFPMTLDFLLDFPGGGLTWIGTYGPTAAWEEGGRRCAELMREHGFPPILVTKAMKGGHYGVLRMITCFDKSDDAEVQRVHALNRELLGLCLDLGFLPYKAPGYAVEEMHRRADPGYLRLLGDVKRCLDPQGIMNPGRWGLRAAPE